MANNNRAPGAFPRASTVVAIHTHAVTWNLAKRKSRRRQQQFGNARASRKTVVSDAEDAADEKANENKCAFREGATKKKKQNTIKSSERSVVDTMCKHWLGVTIWLNVVWLLPCKGFGICAFRCYCMANAGNSSINAGPQSTIKLRYPTLMIDTGQYKRICTANRNIVSQICCRIIEFCFIKQSSMLK